jgi:hypothetical protein
MWNLIRRSKMFGTVITLGGFTGQVFGIRSLGRKGWEVTLRQHNGKRVFLRVGKVKVLEVLDMLEVL